MNDDVVSLVTGIGIGAALGSAAMYVLDPEMGQRRRALARDKMTEAQRKTKNAAAVTARDLRNRTGGMVAEARSRVSDGKVSDDALEGRVRSKLGFLVRHPSAITTHVSEGRVLLSGPVLSDEVEQLIDGVHGVRGVAAVENRLEVHDSPERTPGLQGDRPKPAGEVWDVMQRRWSPSTRFLVGTAGAVSLGMIVYSLSGGSRPSPAPGQQRDWEKAKTEQAQATAGWGI
ncbi:MAG: BON domain-containing protein [Candidatus Binatia bacterium]